MREQERIKRIVGKLEELWNLAPDLRLTQLVYNLSAGHSRHEKAEIQPNPEFFYFEDEKIEDELDRAISIVKEIDQEVQEEAEDEST